MTTKEALKKLKEYIDKQRDQIYSEMRYAGEHDFKIELQALQYKLNAYTDISGEILMLIHKLSQGDEK